MRNTYKLHKQTVSKRCLTYSYYQIKKPSLVTPGETVSYLYFHAMSFFFTERRHVYDWKKFKKHIEDLIIY